MSEEIRFKYLEELERSEALDDAGDLSWERRSEHRNEEKNSRAGGKKKETRRKRGKIESSAEGAEEETAAGSRRKRSEKAVRQTAKKKRSRKTEPERKVRPVEVPESWDGSSFVGDRWQQAAPSENGITSETTENAVYAERRSRRRRTEETEAAGRSTAKRTGKKRRRRDGSRSERVTDWDAFIEETARMETEDGFQEEREERRQNRADAAKRREEEARARRALFMKIGIAAAALILIFIIGGTVIRTIRKGGQSHGSGTAGTQGQDYSGDDNAAGAGNGIGAGVTVAPASSVVSIDSADQLTTVFENWTFTPSATDVAPEGDIVPLTDTFYTHDMMKRDLYLLRERYPDIMTILRFGYTADGRELLDVVIGNPAAEKDVIIQYSMHAREYINSLLGMKQIEELLKGLKSGAQYNGVSYADILDGVRLHLIPMMNPDGVMISLLGFDAIGNQTIRNGLYECWQSDIMLGKGDPEITAYFRGWKANARCVDLNRNFDCGWDTTVGTPQPSCSRYKGESAESESETKALVALKDAINCVGQIAYHSEGEIVYWDYGSKGDLHVLDEQLADVVSAETGYTKESTISAKQETAGCSDYFILECGIPSITIETGVGDCPISIDQWDTIWSQNAQVVPAIAQFFAQL